MFFGRFGPLPKIPKEFKGNQREIKGNVKGNQRKSQEIKGNVKGIFGRCPNLPKIIEKYYFCPDFFLKVDGKLLIYPFLAFLAPSEHSSIEKTTPSEKTTRGHI